MVINPTDPILSIGIAANKLGVSTQLLKKYEREGLIITYKSESGQRLYSERDLEWLDFLYHQTTENNMKIAGLRLLLALIPCWNIKSTGSPSDCKGCKAYKNYNVVCWTLEDPSSRLCREENCRDCEVYHYACQSDNLKKMYAAIEI